MSRLIKSRRKPPRERGVALLMVLVLVTLVAAVVTEFQYSSRVDLQLAYNARDELQAEYNALSALRLRALILRHSRKLNQVANMLMGNTGAGGAAGGGQLPMGQILEMLPVECGLMGALFKPVERDLEESVAAEGFFPGEGLRPSAALAPPTWYPEARWSLKEGRHSRAQTPHPQSTCHPVRNALPNQGPVLGKPRRLSEKTKG